MNYILVFKPARPSDFDYFYALRKRTMLEHFIRAGKGWPDEELDRHKASFNPGTLLMIYIGERRVGFINVTRENGDLYVSHFCIEPEDQNKGVGTAVLKAIAAKAKAEHLNVTLDVLVGNQSHRLYERLGFKRVPGDNPILSYYKKPAASG